ncbi:DUF3280 domain-containing protein [Pseudaminobacter sp. 19-2017]|uniref:DUF3280 domain-containing protein n=1 Tax=Pseudaminobacter soli (ex Zhang et al. 2022) TaxID=2831468 RepID=A0A942I7G2_9HYPH|nr:DUF3280 domain-containing protein [Pseudaminobacter soli]MBS3648365.1 DUF3280 domain-containing protein [Pseudaminobacter soli]
MSAAAQAGGKAAVFQFELRHGDLVPGAPQKLEAEQQRIRLVTDRLRDHFAQSGYAVADMKAVAAKAAALNLDSCTACAADLAQKAGADYAVTGTVYRVSELVLSMNVRVYDAATGNPLSSAVVDMRGNTDESWTRAVDYLYRRMLAPRLEKIAQ